MVKRLEKPSSNHIHALSSNYYQNFFFNFENLLNLLINIYHTLL